MSKEIDISDLRGFLEQTAEITIAPKCQKVMEDVLEQTKEQLYQGFQSGISPDGRKWPALKNPRPPHRNQNNKPLLDTYRLMESVVNETGDHLEAATDQGVNLGTYVEYAGTHQYGHGPVPQRKFLGFSEKIKDKATKGVADSTIKQIDQI